MQTAIDIPSLFKTAGDSDVNDKMSKFIKIVRKHSRYSQAISFRKYHEILKYFKKIREHQGHLRHPRSISL